MNKIMTFFNEVTTEIKRITWPTREELIGSTVIVCILVVVFAVILGSMDALFSLLMKSIIS